jgi:hypothetical protein
MLYFGTDTSSGQDLWAHQMESGSVQACVVAGFTDWILEAAIHDVCGTSQPSAPSDIPGELELFTRGVVVASLRQGLQTLSARSVEAISGGATTPVMLEQAAKNVTATIFGDVEGSLRAELSTRQAHIARHANESDDDTEVAPPSRPPETFKPTEAFKSPRESLLATGSSAATVLLSSASATPTPAPSQPVSSTPAHHESGTKSKSVAARRMHLRKKTNAASDRRFDCGCATLSCSLFRPCTLRGRFPRNLVSTPTKRRRSSVSATRFGSRGSSRQGRAWAFADGWLHCLLPARPAPLSPPGLCFASALICSCLR